MTIDEIKEAADMAETWPDSRALNFAEVGLVTLTEWVRIQAEHGDSFIGTCDIESVMNAFESWWKKETYGESAPSQGGKGGAE